MSLGHTWFVKGCRECISCRLIHPPPAGYTEDDLQDMCFGRQEWAFPYDSADPNSGHALNLRDGERREAWAANDENDTWSPVGGRAYDYDLDGTLHRTDGRTREVWDDGSWIAVSYCYCHNEDEMVPPNTYRICFECGHVWTRRALRRAYRHASSGCTPKLQWSNADQGKANPWQWLRYHVRRLTITAKRVYFCQECIHDW